MAHGFKLIFHYLLALHRIQQWSWLLISLSLSAGRVLSFVSSGCWRNTAKGKSLLSSSRVLAEQVLLWLSQLLAPAVQEAFTAPSSCSARCPAAHRSQQHSAASSRPSKHLSVKSFPGKLQRVNFQQILPAWHYGDFSATKPWTGPHQIGADLSLGSWVLNALSLAGVDCFL